jgi:deoxyribose-phosphate aldolase
MLSHLEIPALIDVSCVQTAVKYEDVENIAAAAKKYKFICAFAMPCFTEKLGALLKGSSVLLGGVVGFPSGADTTAQKVEYTRYMKSIGCNEIDMVINVGALLSGDDAFVRDDIKAVVDAASSLPVKSILECAYLSDDDIKRACNAAVAAGVTFVKSGTGWASKPTTLENIKLMKSTVGDRAQIKAAGGVRSLAILEEMYDAGCRRFGIGLKSALGILKEAYDRAGVAFDENFQKEKA